MYRPQTPQLSFGSITLLQKFTPRFKILDPRLAFNFTFPPKHTIYKGAREPLFSKYWFCKPPFSL